MNKTEVANDNVVGRLYNILKELKDTKGSNAEDTIKKVFDISDENHYNIYIYYSDLYKMSLLGIEEIQSLNLKNSEKYINTLSQVIQGISEIYFNASKGVINNGMDKFGNHFNESLMIKLEMCADFLSEMGERKEVEKEKIEEVIEEIEEIKREIYNLKIDKEFERIIILQLNSISESLFKYRFYGSEGIDSSISTALGKIFLTQDKVTNEEEKSAVKKVLGVIGKLNIIMSFTNNGIKFIENISDKFIN